MHPFVILKLIDVVSILFTRSCRSRNTLTHKHCTHSFDFAPRFFFLDLCSCSLAHSFLAIRCFAMLCSVINMLASKFCNLHIRLSLIVLEPSPPNHHNSSGKTHFLPASVINCPNQRKSIAIQPQTKMIEKAKKNATRVAYHRVVSLAGVLVLDQMKSNCDKVLFFRLAFELYLSMAWHGMLLENECLASIKDNANTISPYIEVKELKHVVVVCMFLLSRRGKMALAAAFYLNTQSKTIEPGKYIHFHTLFDCAMCIQLIPPYLHI